MLWRSGCDRRMHIIMDITPTAEEPDPHQMLDAVSVHSMPAVHITEPCSPPDHRSPVSNKPASLSARPPPPLPSPVPSRTNTMQEEPSSTHQQRRARHCSAVEVCMSQCRALQCSYDLLKKTQSSNRLSGFFNHLIHRREPLYAASQDAISEDTAAQSDPPKINSENTSCTPSPIPPCPILPPHVQYGRGGPTDLYASMPNLRSPALASALDI